MVVVLMIAAACSRAPLPTPESIHHFKVLTESFDAGGTLPVRFTCEGEDVPPSLGWENVPPTTESLALTMTDPDADGFVHWIAVGIPAHIGHITTATLPSGTIEGANDFGTTGYRGPCPPEGDHPHNYRFTLFALDKPASAFSSSFHEGDSLEDMTAAIAEAVVGMGTIEVSYGR